MPKEAQEQKAAHPLMLQFLAWVAESPRTYEESEAWRKSCPHLAIWEDAIGDGLIRFENATTMKQSKLALTPRGRAVLGGH